MENSLVETKETKESALVQGEMAKQVQEVQASLIIAKRFPRDENASYSNIMTACKRKTLAENAMYVYPRGGKTVTGPSIRLAEMIAQTWGNIDFGIRELAQNEGTSEMEAYAWDKQTNTRSTKIFQVKHIRYSKNKGNVELTDPRDIYEMTANQGARRLRSCILQIIPGDIVEEAVRRCEETLTGSSDEPVEDRIRKMVVKFKDIGVTTEMLEQRLGHKLEVTTVHELVQLGAIYKSLSDNMADRRDFFDLPEVNREKEAVELEEKLRGSRGKTKKGDKSVNDVLITQAHITRLFAIADENKVTKDTVTAIISSYGYKSTKEIARVDYDKIIGDIEDSKPDEPPQQSLEELAAQADKKSSKPD
jgi:hypothetical protein